MYGAIIGDIVGSKYEFRPIKTKDFPFVSRGCGFTDDTVMTVAVARALMKTREWHLNCDYRPFKEALVAEMRDLGRRYPGAGYGGRFASWLESPNPAPYNSYGNGSAMRVSPCGIYAYGLHEALELAKASAEETGRNERGWPAWCDELVEGYEIDALLPDEFLVTMEEFDEFVAHHMAYGHRMTGFY